MSRQLFFSLGIVAIFLAGAGSALAQAPASSYDVSWQALDPGNDWVAQMINAVFPINSNPCAAGPSAGCTGTAATVIGQMLGQLTGFTMALAMAYVCYLSIWHIFRAAESSAILTDAMTSLFVVRLGFAAIMMFPLTSGFSIGQAAVIKTSMWGIGMANIVYQNAIKAIGPDAMVIAQPQIPGTKNLILTLMQDEFCAAIINAAAANPQLVPIPTGVTTVGSTSWIYSLAPGDQNGQPVCGSVSVNKSRGTSQPIAGVSTDLTAQQAQILQNVIANDIRPAVQNVAAAYWNSKRTADLAPLQTVFTSANADYTQQLTNAASQIQSQLNAAIRAQDARSGSLGTSAQQVSNLSTLGWASAGSYYLTFSQLNGRTLSLLKDLPIAHAPNLTGLSQALLSDVAPLIAAADNFEASLQAYVNTADGTAPPSGARDGLAQTVNDGSSMIEQLFRSLNITEQLTEFLANQIAPTSTQWSDPFGGLISLGQKMVSASLIALGLAAVASNTTLTTSSALASFFTFNWAGTAASLAASAFSETVKAFATPIFLGILSLLVPGLIIAYVLPMIPFVMWMAGVAGYLILVLEAVIAVPLMMFAHMTFEGPGLHGRAIQVYELLFNVLFRPVLMLLGLFVGYFIFDSMSWLIRVSFGVAIHFVLEDGWLVTNVVGMVVLLSIFVLLHVVIAMKSFDMISLIPHHVPKMLGFSSANRVDMGEFAKAAAWTGTEGTLKTISKGFQDQIGGSSGQAPANSVRSGQQPSLSAPPKALPNPSGGANTKKPGMDSTLSAATDIQSPNPDI